MSNMNRENTYKSGSRSGRESGAVLIVSLLILLGMTLIGVSSMDSAVMELKMSSTMQQQVVAMNRAETTLLAAEARIDTMTTDGATWNFDVTTDGLYPNINTIDIAQADWSGFEAEPGPIFSDNAVDDDDTYVIEYVGMQVIPGGSRTQNNYGFAVGGEVHTFRNTTRSASGRSVVRIVQSVYVTVSAP
jgi:type IV pilus assembly protein PilX